MPLYMGDILGPDADKTASSATEYRRQFMSPRREDYIPHVALPKINFTRPTSRSRSFLSHDIEPNPSGSEYRFRYPNHQPKRPFCFHAQPSHVFDFVPLPPTTSMNNNNRNRSRLDLTPSFTKDTEYQERFPNYRTFIPLQELIPPHLTANTNMPSPTQQKKNSMTQSQYFHELLSDNDKFNGGQRAVGKSEQRTAYQWPFYPSSSLNHYGPIPPISQQQQYPVLDEK